VECDLQANIRLPGAAPNLGKTQLQRVAPVDVEKVVVLALGFDNNYLFK
jgi:hypothetical protein